MMKAGIGPRALAPIMSALVVLADDEVGDALADRLAEIMAEDGIADGLFGFGYGETNPDRPADRSPEKQPARDAQPAVTLNDLKAIYRTARAYW